MIVEKIITKTEPKELDITGATLLSYEEYEKYKTRISRRDYWWWLRSPGSSMLDAFFVDNWGYIYSDSILDNAVAVVPALKIILNSDFKIGDKIKFGSNTFTIISDNYALCDNNIGYHWFREGFEINDANNYEKSDVKKFIDGWFKEQEEK
jgi:hypothetical protein